MVATGRSIDVELARAQHAQYVSALAGAGVEVIQMPTLDEFADACFVEDCAILAQADALITNPGTPSRVGEETTVAELLSRTHRIHRTGPPATIEGGDCMRVGTTWFVGRSTRTNEAGVRRIHDVFSPLGFRVIEVPVVGFLHLKCFCSPIDDRTILVAEDTVDLRHFDGFELVRVPRAEAYAANAVFVNNTAIIAGGYPTTRAAVERLGLRVVELELSEIEKADGSLTCLSLLL